MLAAGMLRRRESKALGARIGRRISNTIEAKVLIMALCALKVLHTKTVAKPYNKLITRKLYQF